MSKITVSPSQTEFTANPDETLLTAAIRQGYNLPHSCQSGVCGSCAAKLISGSVRENQEYDDYVLSAEERAAGKILLCCSQTDEDIVLDMPSYAGAKAKTVRTLPSRMGKIELRGDVAVIRVTLPKAPPFIFHAGQYMEILLKDGSRSYSIASSTQQTESLEFHIRRRENGLFSTQLFSGSLKEGAIIRLRGPLGSFYLSDNHHKPLILLATGTGFAPIKSILAHIAQTQPERTLHVYHGVRQRTGLYDETALRELLAQLPNARYTPVLSQPENGWTGATGYVTDHVLRDYPDLSQHEVYACGLPKMVHDSRHAFVSQAQLPEAAYFSDVFTAHI
ncbi:2Fe-2S iron-sulfur cluster-binding protein [Kingella negevensis]|uniref:CDP-6-deoxy-L-threo-D-glycero-4-hexulose-3-dehydr ase reductase n=1 Tax=Kingella negevensis TaxID=1522312 RepID=A0A238TEB9_9NEIS|nr:2Fe-2S iron-sulfur cluster-binding protein [Kingella negevensis]MDK4680401.1 2Fe-2S iron-sulfur cluster-binding protein [Kingella negevensis]MDK4681876.1 2Fe-2S iron-sulfur cluster-binding protein [Kingella negevensis]MDK4685608.1 2Fe-2S iron-sulfur cluster-binding protein [Kingella negevensis]MDK4690073.1 2Fe-2S iron-sulfur cluster-binding protein [Kingella negevensis]MDK4692581.1 2Fe-2S iron-sulfur cluster-binding protein [Kingella negevensis]